MHTHTHICLYCKPYRIEYRLSELRCPLGTVNLCRQHIQLLYSLLFSFSIVLVLPRPPLSLSIYLSCIVIKATPIENIIYYVYFVADKLKIWICWPINVLINSKRLFNQMKQNFIVIYMRRWVPVQIFFYGAKFICTNTIITI